MNYCSKDHQKIDWTFGEHKNNCGNQSNSKPGNDNHKYLLNEFDLVTESEQNDEKNTSTDDNDIDEARRLNEYEEFVKMQNENHTNNLVNVPDEEFEKYIAQTDDDNVFHKFKTRIATDPEQVIRFDRGGIPLWITTKHQAKNTDIPSCEKCNGPRIFEFQVSFVLFFRHR